MDRNEKSGGSRSMLFSYAGSLIGFGIKFFIVCGIIAIVLLVAYGLNIRDIFKNPVFHGKSYRMAFEMKEALEKEDNGKVKELIRKEPAYAKSKDEDGGTLLHETISRVVSPRERITIMEMLIERGADVNAQDRTGSTPLHYAWRHDSYAAVKLLIDNGAKVDIKNNEGDTPLNRIAGRTSADTVILLLSKGADINSKNNDQSTPLMSAAGYGSPAVVKLLIDKGALVDATDSNGNTALYRAACTGSIETARLLLAEGADINARSASQATPLGGAALNRKEDMLRFLLSLGADADGCDDNGEPALHRVVGTGNVELAKLLISKGADPNRLCEKGCAPLHHVHTAGMAECLISNGVLVNQKDKEGRTPAFNAVRNGSDQELLPLLCSHGADPNIQDNQGLTCLHVAVMEKSYVAVKFLLNHGAGINIRDKSGHTPLYYAQKAYKERNSYDSNTGSIYINLLTEKGGKI